MIQLFISIVVAIALLWNNTASTHAQGFHHTSISGAGYHEGGYSGGNFHGGNFRGSHFALSIPSPANGGGYSGDNFHGGNFHGSSLHGPHFALPIPGPTGYLSPSMSYGVPSRSVTARYSQPQSSAPASPESRSTKSRSRLPRSIPSQLTPARPQPRLLPSQFGAGLGGARPGRGRLDAEPDQIPDPRATQTTPPAKPSS
jgi:hypothetical protein